MEQSEPKNGFAFILFFLFVFNMIKYNITKSFCINYGLIFVPMPNGPAGGVRKIPHRSSVNWFFIWFFHFSEKKSIFSIGLLFISLRITGIWIKSWIFSKIFDIHESMLSCLSDSFTINFNNLHRHLHLEIRKYVFICRWHFIVRMTWTLFNWNMKISNRIVIHLHMHCFHPSCFTFFPYPLFSFFIHFVHFFFMSKS